VTARSQVWALVRLRWTLVRSPWIRVGLLTAAALVPYFGFISILIRNRIEPAALVAAVNAAPAAFLGFGVLAVVAPLTAGGTELFPSDQLVAYPVRPATHFLSSLVLAPVNLVWIVQLLVLTAETGFLTLDHPYLGQGALTSLMLVLACTSLGQAMAWVVTGLRRSRNGRLLLRTTLGLGAAGALTVIRTGHSHDVVDYSFGPAVAKAVTAGGAGDLRGWIPTTVGGAEADASYRSILDAQGFGN